MTDSLFNVDEVAPVERPTARSTQSLSLYRKYRPQSFASDELFGQDHIVNTLRNAIRLDRIAHAYLFCGPRGTGKTTTARILAKAVNCLDPDPANRPCNQCDACRAINANATTDVIEIDAASNRGIDDIRELRERVKYAPTMLRTKFYIIDEAHQITGAAANAFLKTLEEPPPHTKFVLATTDPEELLQTIVSRCQRFDFRRISLDAMTARLRQVAEAEGFEIDDDAIATIARHATGSLRDALGILDQVAVYREEADASTESSRITIELVRTVLGVSRNDRVEGMVRAIADQDPGAGLRIINEAVDAGEDVRQLGRQLISYLRVLMLERASGTPEADETARELAGRFDLPQLARVATHFADIDYKARHAAIVQLPLELALIEACSPVPVRVAEHASQAPVAATPQPEPPARKPRGGPSLRDRVRGASMNAGQAPPQPQAKPSSPPVPETAPPAPEPPARTIAEAEPAPAEQYTAATGEGSADLDAIVERWDNIRMDVKALNRRTEALLQQADPLHVEGERLTLVAAYPFHQKRLNDDDTRKVIEGVIERQVGKKISVICVSRDEAQALRPSSQPPAAPATPPDAAPSPMRAREAEDASPPTDGPADDDGDPAPATVSPSTDTSDAGPSVVSSLDLDEQRIEAAINIFDAVIIDDE